MIFMLDHYEELKTLITRLNEARIEYALGGGLALALYGIPRATVDLDLLIQEENLDQVRMKVDMSPKAISNRLKLVSQLRRLCLSLSKAKPVVPQGEGLRAKSVKLKEKS